MDFIVSSKKLKENQERVLQKEREEKKQISDEKWFHFELFCLGLVAGMTFVAVLLEIWI